MDEIRTVIARFANSFDLKDWESLRRLLGESIDVDYSDLRGTKETISAQAYVQKRIDALAPLKTQHQFANLEITVEGDWARCRASAQILRALEGRRFDTHAIYDFGLRLGGEGWRIASIRQRVLWNEGDPSIHAGAREKSAS